MADLRDVAIAAAIEALRDAPHEYPAGCPVCTGAITTIVPVVLDAADRALAEADDTPAIADQLATTERRAALAEAERETLLRLLGEAIWEDCGLSVRTEATGDDAALIALAREQDEARRAEGDAGQPVPAATKVIADGITITSEWPGAEPGDVVWCARVIDQPDRWVRFEAEAEAHNAYLITAARRSLARAGWSP